MTVFKLQILLDEQLPLPPKLKATNKHHNLKHVIKLPHLQGKDDPTVYMGAKKLGRILITLDKGFYQSTEFKYYKDTGIIYIKEGGQSYNLPPDEIDRRLQRLFKVLNTKDKYYNVKIKICDDHAMIKCQNNKEVKITI
ncbi:MAG: DUF5615 family PIN-like protein [Candidatus Margulisbacteria bacterium]|nr:DUF5615 family PIN-like protein [Candidatus Margulisiibacteriota bacterium]